MHTEESACPWPFQGKRGVGLDVFVMLASKICQMPIMLTFASKKIYYNTIIDRMQAFPVFVEIITQKQSCCF